MTEETKKTKVIKGEFSYHDVMVQALTSEDVLVLIAVHPVFMDTVKGGIGYTLATMKEEGNLDSITADSLMIVAHDKVKPGAILFAYKNNKTKLMAPVNPLENFAKDKIMTNEVGNA